MNLKISSDYLESILTIYDDLFKDLEIEKQTYNESFNNIELPLVDLKYYISSSTSILKKMLKQAICTNNPKIIYPTLEVFNYLVYPKDILPDSQFYLMSYFDDAWLIHNYVHYEFEDYSFNLDDINVDWTKINYINTAINTHYDQNKYKRLHQKMKRVINLN